MTQLTDARRTRAVLLDCLNSSLDEVSFSSSASSLSVDPAAIPTPELQHSFRRLTLLYELAQQICAETDEGRVFERILSAVVELLKIERAFIAVLSDGNLIPRAKYKIDLPRATEKWPLSTTMLQRVLKDRIALLTTDAQQDERYGNVPSVDRHNIRSVMCCPLGGKREPKGVIYADNRASARAFQRADLEFLNALSHFAFLAIENADERRRITAAKELAEARFNAAREDLGADADAVGVSKPLVQVYMQAKRVAKKDVPVLLVGETGTGKEVFARLLHSCSSRSEGPFIAVNIAALPKTLIESELFGHEKGAFTGAEKKRVGRFELARGGTLFLDEVQDIPLDVQPKLLRVLEQRTFEPLGSNSTMQADVRLVCACNKDPALQVKDGLLREDLYYRLNSIMLELPPLRERREDIPLLIHHFLERCKSDKVFDEESLSLMTHYRWPGNVRELKNCVEAIDALVEGNIVRKTDLPKRIFSAGEGAVLQASFEPLPQLIERIEKEHILRAIKLTGGKNDEAIALLGISRAKYFQRKKEYEGEKEAEKGGEPTTRIDQ